MVEKELEVHREEVETYVNKELIPALISMSAGSYKGSAGAIEITCASTLSMTETALVEFKYTENGDCDCHITAKINVDAMTLSESHRLRVRGLAGDSKAVVDKIRKSLEKIMNILVTANIEGVKPDA